MAEILRDMNYAQLHQVEKEEYLCKEIVTTMDGDGPRRVVLTGKSGIGKTRLAKMVGERATRREGLCYLTICLHLNNKFEDELSLYENIAFQIGAYNRDEKQEKKPEDLLKDLKEKISAKLKKKYTSAVEKRKMEKKHTSSAFKMLLYLLLILDDEGITSEDKVMNDFGLEEFLIENFPGDHFPRYYLPLKLLITRREGDENAYNETEYHATDESQSTKRDGETESNDIMVEPQDTRSEEQIESHTTSEIRVDTNSEGKIEFHTTDMSLALLDTLTELNLRVLFHSIVKDKTMDLLKSLDELWISSVVRKNSSLPAATVVLAKSLNCITHRNTFKSLSPKQEKVTKELLSPCEPAYSVSADNHVLQLAYQLLETDDTLKNAIVDCFWHSLDLFKHCGSVHYSELITIWILEGYFDPVRSVKKAYNDAHAILVELINRGILKIQEGGDMVVPEMAMNNLFDLRHHGLLGRSRLQFARVYGGDKSKGLGKIIQIDDMIKTVEARKRDNVSTILVSGNRLRRETPKEFFEQMASLEVVGFFDPTLECLTEYLRDLKELRVLVIRNCDLLSDIEELRCLQGLNVLEVSGASSLETISDDFFASMPGLQTLNLSGLLIKHSPSSISHLEFLQSLILRDCPLLEDLPDIQELLKLEVIDVRGAYNLKNCYDKRFDKGSNQNFRHLTRLQLIDFSESKVKRLPMFQDAAVATKLHSLTRLLLQNCSNLMKLPNLKPLSGLQILDLSGTTGLVEISAVWFEDKNELKILNLSGTKVSQLPLTIFELSNLNQLLLRDSANLEALPNIEGLSSLEVFDVSGCTKLHTIEGSFKDMSYLREVNLSGTRMETIPEFPEKSNICCSKLVVLPDSRRLVHDSWSRVKEAITDGMSGSQSASNMVDRIQEVSRKEIGKVRELWAFNSPEKEGRGRVHFQQGHIYKDVYLNTIPFVDNKSCQEVLEIQGSNGVDQDKETLAKAEFVAFVDTTAASLSSIFNDLKSMKGCWVEKCGDIEFLFSGVDKERLGNLETLSITNLGRLEIVCSSSFKNLKKLSLDCCPRIKTLFLASDFPTSLEVLKIKFCDKLEKVFEQEVEVPSLHTLCLFKLPLLCAINAMLPNLKTYKIDKCPGLITSMEDLCGPVLERV